MALNLSELDAVTSASDSDLVHIRNTSGIDKKITWENFQKIDTDQLVDDAVTQAKIDAGVDSIHWDSVWTGLSDNPSYTPTAGKTYLLRGVVSSVFYLGMIYIFSATNVISGPAGGAYPTVEYDGDGGWTFLQGSSEIDINAIFVAEYE